MELWSRLQRPLEPPPEWIAAAVGVTAPKKPKAPKLVVNRNESRLPRRQKKTAQKVATRAKRATKVKAAS
jgi:hypothetical protein